MQKLFRLMILLFGSLAMNPAFAEQQIGVSMPAIEDVGAITYVDNASGSITIGTTRYELTNDTIIHYSDYEDAAVGYGKFKFSKDMNLGFKLENSNSNRGTNRISEVWVSGDK